MPYMKREPLQTRIGNWRSCPTEQENKPYGQRYKKQKTEILSKEDVEKGYENIIKFYKNLLNNIKHQIIMIR